MKRFTEDFIQKARKLRAKEKLSLKELGRRIGISGGTVSCWFREPVGNRWDSLLIANEKRRQDLRKSEVSVVPHAGKITRNEAKFLAGLLYGCEGSKYPAQNGVAFANSDPNLVVAFLKLLREGFDLNEDKFTVHLQIHTTHNFVKVRQYWSKLLFIKEDHFIKPTITPPTGKKHRGNYMGTCTLRYRDYRIQLKLLGIFEEFTKGFNKRS